MRCREDEEFEEANVLLRKISTESNPTTSLLEEKEGVVYITSYVDLLVAKFTLEIRSCPYGVAGVSGKKLGNGMKFWDEASMTFVEMIQEKGFDNGDVNRRGRALELGCGATGVPGLTLGYCGFAATIDFMDHDSMCLQELSSNIKRNLVKQHSEDGSTCSSGSSNGSSDKGDSGGFMAEFNVLSARSYDDIIQKGGIFLENGESLHYDLIIGCELVFDLIDIDSLARCIHTLLTRSNKFILCQSVKGRGKVFEFIEIMMNYECISCIERNVANGNTMILRSFEKCHQSSVDIRGQWMTLNTIDEVRQIMQSKDILLLSFEIKV